MCLLWFGCSLSCFGVELCERIKRFCSIFRWVFSDFPYHYRHYLKIKYNRPRNWDPSLWKVFTVRKIKLPPQSTTILPGTRIWSKVHHPYFQTIVGSRVYDHQWLLKDCLKKNENMNHHLFLILSDIWR